MTVHVTHFVAVVALRRERRRLRVELPCLERGAWKSSINGGTESIGSRENQMVHTFNERREVSRRLGPRFRLSDIVQSRGGEETRERPEIRP